MAAKSMSWVRDVPPATQDKDALERELEATKRELKKYESEFTKQHGRKITTADVESSPIFEKYRTYRKLKAALSDVRTGKTGTTATGSVDNNLPSRAEASDGSVSNSPPPDSMRPQVVVAGRPRRNYSDPSAVPLASPRESSQPSSLFAAVCGSTSGRPSVSVSRSASQTVFGSIGFAGRFGKSNTPLSSVPRKEDGSIGAPPERPSGGRTLEKRSSLSLICGNSNASLYEVEDEGFTICKTASLLDTNSQSQDTFRDLMGMHKGTPTARSNSFVAPGFRFRALNTASNLSANLGGDSSDAADPADIGSIRDADVDHSAPASAARAPSRSSSSASASARAFAASQARAKAVVAEEEEESERGTGDERCDDAGEEEGSATPDTASAAPELRRSDTVPVDDAMEESASEGRRSRVPLQDIANFGSLGRGAPRRVTPTLTAQIAPDRVAAARALTPSTVIGFRQASATTSSVGSCADPAPPAAGSAAWVGSNNNNASAADDAAARDAAREHADGQFRRRHLAGVGDGGIFDFDDDAELSPPPDMKDPKRHPANRQAVSPLRGRSGRDKREARARALKRLRRTKMTPAAIRRAEKENAAENQAAAAVAAVAGAGALATALGVRAVGAEAGETDVADAAEAAPTRRRGGRPAPVIPDLPEGAMETEEPTAGRATASAVPEVGAPSELAAPRTARKPAATRKRKRADDVDDDSDAPPAPPTKRKKSTKSNEYGIGPQVSTNFVRLKLKRGKTKGGNRASWQGGRLKFAKANNGFKNHFAPKAVSLTDGVDAIPEDMLLEPEKPPRKPTAAEIAEQQAEADRRREERERRKTAAEERVVAEAQRVRSAYRSGSIDLTSVLQSFFRFDNFRDGQQEAIQRTMEGKSSLVILPTGAGKSLCYQIPALLMDGLVLVVCPLVALMADQISHLPNGLVGASLSSTQTLHQINEVEDAVQRGAVKVLFVSPERLGARRFINLMRGEATGRPVKLAFACVDEAHCVSEWSHNFRPDYLRLNQILRHQLGVSHILALTATATSPTVTSVLEILNIDRDGLIRTPTFRANLQLTASREHNRQAAFLEMLQHAPLRDCASIVVYTTRREETEEIAAFLTAGGHQAKAYHAGRSAVERRRVQNEFMSNKLRIIVATLAFGMGVDKADVRAVVHYRMPRSLETYVQEVGRAGRDGLPAFCHLFLHDEDYIRQRSLSYADGIDKPEIKRFLKAIFIPAKKGPKGAEVAPMETEADEAAAYEAALCQAADEAEAAHAAGKSMWTNLRLLPQDSTAQQFDVEIGVIGTILSLLESRGIINILTPQYGKFRITTRRVREETSNASHIWDAIDACRVRGGTRAKSYDVDALEMARRLGCTIKTVGDHLLNLQREGYFMAEQVDWSFFIEIVRPLDAEGVHAVSSELSDKLTQLEKAKVYKVNCVRNTIDAIACDTWRDAMKAAESTAEAGDTAGDADGRQGFQHAIDDYFRTETPLGELSAALPLLRLENREDRTHIRNDIRVFLSTVPPMTPRAVARIFHGIQSPMFSAREWYKHHCWRRHATVDFDELRRIATDLIPAAAARQAAKSQAS